MRYFKQAIINTNGMNVDDKVEVDCILEKADILIPDSSHELMGAVGIYTIYMYAVCAEEIEPQEGSNRKMRIGGDSFQGSPPSHSNVYWCRCKTLPRVALQY